GKAIVAGNALKHGLRSPRPVVTGLESAEQWEVHREAIVADLAPVGAVEAALAERAALYLWRLGRCADHETTLIEVGRDAAAQDLRAGTLSPHESDLGTQAGPLAKEVSWARTLLAETMVQLDKWRKAAALIAALIPEWTPTRGRRRQAKA